MRKSTPILEINFEQICRYQIALYRRTAKTTFALFVVDKLAIWPVTTRDGENLRIGFCAGFR